MARIARLVVPGVAHHVTQRGNRRTEIFYSDNDRRRFLSLLHAYAQDCGLELLAYCLMDNHLHLVVVPEHESSLARVLKPVNLRYAQHVNKTQGWSGRLWQERFFSCPMDPVHTLLAVRYVEQNPVRAGMVRAAQDYLWSSAAGHTGVRHDPLLSDRRGLLSSIEDWAEWLKTEDDSEELERLRMRTRTGRPMGSASFVDELERQAGRRLRALPRGRARRGNG